MIVRTGFYVNGRRFPLTHRAQAIARATFLAHEFLRDVSVEEVDYEGRRTEHYCAQVLPLVSSINQASG